VETLRQAPQRGGDPCRERPSARSRRILDGANHRQEAQRDRQREERFGHDELAERHCAERCPQDARGDRSAERSVEPRPQRVSHQDQADQREGRRETRSQLALPEKLERGGREPVDERGLLEARDPIERRDQPVPRVDHLPGRARILARKLIVDIRNPRGPDVKRRDREEERGRGYPGEPRARPGSRS